MKRAGMITGLAILLLAVFLTGARAQARPEAPETLPKAEISWEGMPAGLLRRNGSVCFRLTVTCDRETKAVLRTTGIYADRTAETLTDAVLHKGETYLLQKAALTYETEGIRFEILDETGRTVLASCEYTAGAEEEAVRLNVGILSDSPERLESLNDLPLNAYPDGSFRTFRLTVYDLPEEAAALSVMDVLLVDDFDTARLSVGQQEAILSWVRGGGRLIIGTGAAASRTTSLLRDRIVHTEPPEGRPTAYGLLPAASVKYDTGGWTDVLSAMRLKDSRALQPEDGIPMATEAAEGAGRIVLCSFALDRLAEFLETFEEEYQLGLPRFSEWIEGLAGNDYILSRAVYQETLLSEIPWMRQEAIRPAETEAAVPGAAWWILAAYALLAGPALYAAARRFGRRSYIPAGIICLAGLGSVLILMSTSSVRHSRPFLTYASLRTAEGGTVRTESIGAVRNPFDRSLTVDLPDAETVLEDRFGRMGDAARPMKAVLDKRDGEDRLQISGAVSFEPVYLRLEKEEAGEPSAEADLRLEMGRLSGTVRMTDGTVLEDACLVYGSTLIPLGRLSGEEAAVRPEDALELLPTERIAAAAGESGAGQPARRGILEWFFASWDERMGDEACLIGFAAPKENVWKETGRQCDLSGLTLYVQPVRPAGTDTEESLLYLRSRRLSGDTYMDNRVMSGSEAEVEYYPSARRGELWFLPSAREDAFRGEIRIFLPREDRYLTLEDGRLPEETLFELMDADGAVRVRYVRAADAQGDTVLPAVIFRRR